MFGTFDPSDVTLLLKDITGLVEPLPSSVREKLIQGGTHYCEMLPLEYRPSEEYMLTYRRALKAYAPFTASAVASVAAQIYGEIGDRGAIVSLARAGTPIGVLIKRYIKQKYGCDIAHYSISIIRGRGIDKNAMKYILSRHDGANIRFVDGWTGKGAIKRQLDEALSAYPGASRRLAVLSDPGGFADICGTHDDFLIPSSCLNSTVSGLLSRTFLRSDIIGEDDFHGAAFYKELMGEDLTHEFLDAVQARFPAEPPSPPEPIPRGAGMEEVEAIRKAFGIRDVNLVKPGTGEATRVLLRRVPWKILVMSLDDESHLGHIYRLAAEKGAILTAYPLKHYRACGLIKELGDV